MIVKWPDHADGPEGNGPATSTAVAPEATEALVQTSWESRCAALIPEAAASDTATPSR